MLTTLKLLAIAARLLATPPHEGPTTADEICVEHWTSGSDEHLACAQQLEHWRCGRQGWCDRDESAPYEAGSDLPDPIKAGRR